MKRLLLDTFCWVELLQGGGKASVVEGLLSGGSEVFIASITLAEVSAKLHATGRGSDAQRVLASITARARVVDVTPGIACRAGELWQQHHARENTGLADCIIAASAEAFDAVVVTGDVHFKAFKGAHNIIS